MSANDTPRHRAQQPKVIAFNGLARRRRAYRRPAADNPAPSAGSELQSGTILGYFLDGSCFEVSYGSTQDLWIKYADPDLATYPLEVYPLDEFDAFEALVFDRFAHLTWREGETRLSYNGAFAEPPAGLQMHSPAEMTIARKALVLYWHFTSGYPVDPADGIYTNPSPQYVDPTNPQPLHRKALT
jgi:hypothetical protein